MKTLDDFSSQLDLTEVTSDIESDIPSLGRPSFTSVEGKRQENQRLKEILFILGEQFQQQRSEIVNKKALLEQQQVELEQLPLSKISEGAIGRGISVILARFEAAESNWPGIMDYRNVFNDPKG